MPSDKPRNILIETPIGDPVDAPSTTMIEPPIVDPTIANTSSDPDALNWVIQGSTPVMLSIEVSIEAQANTNQIHSRINVCP